MHRVATDQRDPVHPWNSHHTIASTVRLSLRHALYLRVASVRLCFHFDRHRPEDYTGDMQLLRRATRMASSVLALFFVVVALSTLTTLPAAAQHGCDPGNLIPNCDFEQSSGDLPSGWSAQSAVRPGGLSIRLRIGVALLVRPIQSASLVGRSLRRDHQHPGRRSATGHGVQGIDRMGSPGSADRQLRPATGH